MAAISRCAILALAAWAADGLRARGSVNEAEEQHKRVLALQEDKLAFCHLPQVAEPQFASLFNTLNNIEGAGLDPDFSSVSRLSMQWSEVTRDDGWRFAMFVRHPIERYLFTFLAECLTDEEVNHCAGPTLPPSAPLEDKVKLFEERVASDVKNGIADDEHWLSQVMLVQRYCGAEFEDPEQLDFLGHVLFNQAKTHGDVQEMLKKYSSVPEPGTTAIDHFPIEGMMEGLRASMGREIKFKPQSSVAKEVEDIKAFYKSGFSLRDVMKLYADDMAKYKFINK